MKKLYGILLVLALLGAGAWLFFRPAGDEMAAVKPQIGPVVQAVYATGTVEPTIMIPISPRISARLLALNADEGQSVEKDQVLAQLEDTDIQGRLADAQAQGDLAQKDYNRKAPLAKQGFVAKQSLDQAQATLKSAQSTIEQIKAEIGYLKLISPEAGRIIRRDGEVGELVASGKPVFWISCCAPMRIAAEVDEEDVMIVQPGQAVLIRADAFPGEIFKGEVQSITPKGDAVSRSYRVRIGLDSAAGDKLMIGMTAEANIVIAEKPKALLVPSAAVKNNAVWIVESGRLQKRDVGVGARTPEAAEIVKGVSENDIVVAEPSPILKEGDRASPKLTEWKAR